MRPHRPISARAPRRGAPGAPARAAGLVLLLTLPSAARPQDAATAAAGAERAVPQEAGAVVVARGGGYAVTRDELEPLLLDRFGMASPGRDLLKLLISAKVLDQLGREEGVTISDAEVTRRWRELDQQVRAAGGEGGIEAEIESRGLGAAEFRDYLRLQLLQEELTRRALELEPGAPVSPDSQEVWLGQTLVERGLEKPPPPWTDGVVARCGTAVVTTDELGAELLGKLEDADVREAAWHLLLLEGLEKRMPDLSAEARAAALEAEMDRRAEKAEETVRAQGAEATFEELLRQKGTSYAALARDPSVAIAALTRLWVDRKHGEDGLRRTYQAERDFFDGRFGTALHVHAIFLVAGAFENDLVKRTFDEADAQLEALKPEVRDLEAFRAYARRNSEDPGTRNEAGDLGWITRLDPRKPEDLRLPLFAYYDALSAGGRELPTQGALVGPVRFESGSALLHVSEIRPTPGWDEMRAIVHEELRRRLIEDLVPLEAVELVVR